VGVTPAAAPMDAEPESVFDDGRHPVALTDVDVAGATVEFDLVQFLRDAEADGAWAERYPNEPPGAPNDYLIINDNPRLRTLPVVSGVPVTVAYLDPMGGDDSSRSPSPTCPATSADTTAAHPSTPATRSG
jgi:hypothetical protein